MKTEESLQAVFYKGTIEDNFLGHIMAEVYKDQVYRPFLPFDKKDTLALDVGGHVGIVSLYLSNYFERVVTLEPSKQHFQCLLRNIQSNNASNIEPVNKALYISTGNFPFGGPKDNTTMRSLHMGTWPDRKSDEEVEALTIDDLFKEKDIKHVDLLKLDVEGSEIEILSSSGFRNVSDKIDLIVGERHNWSGRHPNQLDDALKNCGFFVENIPNDAALFVARKK